MKKNSNPHTSQDYDRKHRHDHVSYNPRAVKDLPGVEESGIIDTGSELDKRKLARQEHTNHFTNRAGGENK